MFSLIRPTKVEGHGGGAGHIHHSQGGKLLQLLRKGESDVKYRSQRSRREEIVISKEVRMPDDRKGKNKGKFSVEVDEMI